MGARESTPPSGTFQLSGAGGIRAAMEAVHGFGAAQCLASVDASRIAIVVEELVANIFEHGGVAEDGIVELMLSRDEEMMTIVITDPGVPFDPREAVMPDVVPERGGGAGIGLVKAWAEILDYRSAGGRNRLDVRMTLGKVG